MEKRLFLAIALSLLVLLTWSRFLPRPPAPAPAPIPVRQPQSLPSAPALNLNPATSPPSSEFSYLQDKSRLVFVEPQAAIKEVVFQDYQDYKFSLTRGLFVGETQMAFTRQLVSNNEVRYFYQDKDKEITKRLLFSKSKRDMILEVKVQNRSASPLTFTLPVYLGVLDFAAQKNRMSYQDVAVADQEKTIYPNIRKDSIFNQLKFMGLRDRYFCLIVQPEFAGYTGVIKKTQNGSSEVSLLSPELHLAPSQASEQKFHIYLGPQDLGIIKSIQPEWQAIIYYGKFDLVAQALLQLLEVCFKLTRNWGWAIILLSLVIYFILFPLTLKQMRSMKEMQHLQPQIEELRRMYQDNPQRLNKEIMELYRVHKVNPFGGCLPLLLQIPIFFALYQVLTRSIALKGAHFLWIKDLSDPDRLLKFPVELPFLGQHFNLLPILMAIGMFIQQKTSMGATSGSSAEQQKMMLIVFPIMFGVIFYNMPAGLVLYWFMNSSLALAYQLRLAQSK